VADIRGRESEGLRYAPVALLALIGDIYAELTAVAQ
jgi:hypothetical protein